jgi:Putative Ig domain
MLEISRLIPRTGMCIRCATTLLFLLVGLSPARAEIVIQDIFGRRLNENGLTLVDWEGQIANPAIKFFVVPPRGAVFPAKLLLASSESRLYFNLPSEIDSTGPRKLVDFKNKQKQPIWVSTFPSRDGTDFDFDIQLLFQDYLGTIQRLKLKGHVINQDRKGDAGLPVTVDFSWDRTGFFNDEKKRQIVTQAARDWMYFFEPASLKPTPPGKEKFFIYDVDSFKKGQFFTNKQSLTGFLLNATGVHSDELHSGGGAATSSGYLSVNGKEIGVRRTGLVQFETQGNFNTKGWILSLDDADFWKATNQKDIPNDLYSIAHHEIGHAICFHKSHPAFEKAEKPEGQLESPALTEYYGAPLKIDNVDHFYEAVDPASRRGIFGNEYHGEMPKMRWQITKLDLLCAQAVGYSLRMTSAFMPLEIQAKSLPAGKRGVQYSEFLAAKGGLPFYNWELTSGLLPTGLRLNSFSGGISGTPIKAGVSEFTVRVRDYDEKAVGKSCTVRLEIGGK